MNNTNVNIWKKNSIVSSKFARGKLKGNYKRGHNGFCAKNCDLHPCYRVKLKEEFTCKKRNKLIQESKARNLMRKNDIAEAQRRKEINLLGEDTLDNKGKDISYEEFIENEIFFECL